MELFKALWQHEKGPKVFAITTVFLVSILLIALVLGGVGKAIRASGGRPVTAFIAQLVTMFFLVSGLTSILSKLFGMNIGF